MAGPKKENRGRTRGDVGGPRKRSINYKRLSRVSLLKTHTPLAPPLEVSRVPHIAESRRYRARSQAQPLHQAHMGV